MKPRPTTALDRAFAEGLASALVIARAGRRPFWRKGPPVPPPSLAETTNLVDDEPVFDEEAYDDVLNEET